MTQTHDKSAPIGLGICGLGMAGGVMVRAAAAHPGYALRAAADPHPGPREAFARDFNASAYMTRTWEFLEFQDVFSGLVKAAVFGFIIALMGCYQGYNSRGGAQGVGAATTNAVVSASILILTFNYVITELFFAR